ncbi:MAG: type II secretion system protein [Candidatus Gastranaerophilaceae bacterium]
MTFLLKRPYSPFSLFPKNVTNLSTHPPIHLKKAAFTLAEVLITLGIIGVVAAMTIPGLMTRLNNIKLKSQFKEGYSLLAQGVKMFNSDDERTASTIYSASVFMKYFKGATLCTTQDAASTHCMGRKETGDDGSSKVTNKDYKYTNYAKNSEYISTFAFDDSQFYLNNNMLIIIDQNVSSWGNYLVTIDVNGKAAKPNAAGHDLFTFELRESEKEGGIELVPMGAPDTHFNNKNTYCSKSSKNTYNGIGCAYYAMQNEDFFKDLP